MKQNYEKNRPLASIRVLGEFTYRDEIHTVYLPIVKQRKESSKERRLLMLDPTIVQVNTIIDHQWRDVEIYHLDVSFCLRAFVVGHYPAATV